MFEHIGHLRFQPFSNDTGIKVIESGHFKIYFEVCSQVA